MNTVNIYLRKCWKYTGTLHWVFFSKFMLFPIPPWRQSSPFLRAMLLLLLSHFSRVQLCATPETAAHQAPPSLGSSRQEHWNGLPFPPQCVKVKSEKWSPSVVSDSSRPHGCSPPGSPVPGILQARVLEWGAIVFSKNQLKPNLPWSDSCRKR